MLDPRTRQILFKMVNKGFVDHVHGAISTGKEANVYHATRSNPTGDDEADVAIKVYKTSILVFKDREQYISGDYRFSNGCSKGNPRKMVRAARSRRLPRLTLPQVKMWAEKEARNLARMHDAGIRCPKPLQLRNHVLAMTFIGRDSKVRRRARAKRLLLRACGHANA